MYQKQYSFRHIFLALIIGMACMAHAEKQKGLAVKDGRFIKDGVVYRGVGANYFELLRRILRDPTNTTSLVGLEKLAQSGIPFVRFGGPYFAKEWRLYLEDRAEYFRRFDLVVRKAEEVGIGLIPSLFWTLTLCETVNEPRDQWGNLQSKTLERMRQYTVDVVSRYQNSPALWAWEFGNEMNLLVDLPNAGDVRPKHGSERDDVTSAHLVTMLTEFARTVRTLDATRPIISGNSHARTSAWNNTAFKNFNLDSSAQAREIILRDNPAPLDTLGIHFYGDHSVQESLGGWVTNRRHYLGWLRELADATQRPIFIGEFGVAQKKDVQTVRPIFEALLTEMEATGVDLAAFWVYDLPAQNGVWSVTAENDRAYMLALTVEANRRWKQSAESLKRNNNH